METGRDCVHAGRARGSCLALFDAMNVGANGRSDARNPAKLTVTCLYF
jgi:hypothetical protein